MELSAGDHLLFKLQIGIARQNGLPTGVYPEAEWAIAALLAAKTLSLELDQAYVERAIGGYEARRRLAFAAYPQLATVLTPFQYWVLIKRQIMIEKACIRYGARDPGRVIIGIGPSGAVNSMIFRATQSAEHVVLCDTGLKVFSNQITKLITRAYLRSLARLRERATSPALLEEALGMHDLAASLRAMLIRWVYEGSPILPAPLDFESGVGAEERDFSGQLETALELFAVGHEYAHAILSHLEEATPQSSGQGDGGQEVAMPWQEEQDADRLGFRLMMLGSEALSPDGMLSYCGAQLFITCTYVIRRAVALAAKGRGSEGVSATHPPPEQRMITLINEGKDWQARRGLPVELAFPLAMLFDGIVKGMAFGLDKELMDGYRQNRPIASLWTQHPEFWN